MVKSTLLRLEPFWAKNAVACENKYPKLHVAHLIFRDNLGKECARLQKEKTDHQSRCSIPLHIRIPKKSIGADISVFLKSCVSLIDGCVVDKPSQIPRHGAVVSKESIHANERQLVQDK